MPEGNTRIKNITINILEENYALICTYCEMLKYLHIKLNKSYYATQCSNAYLKIIDKVAYQQKSRFI